MARTVTGVDGRTWTVRRRWVPRLGAESLWGRFRRRVRSAVRRVLDSADIAPGGFDVLGEGLVTAFVVVFMVMLAVFTVVPVLVAVLDVLVILVLAALGFVARVLLRRPWTVEASAEGSRRRTWRVVGFRAAGREVDRIADGLASDEITSP